jgi:PHS family inorganic phosphate transporter-like MFS transporter
MVLPMLGIIYYDGAVPHNYETALSVVTLGGSIIGQIFFGLAADIWGRRKYVYLWSRALQIAGAVGLCFKSLAFLEAALETCLEAIALRCQNFY